MQLNLSLFSLNGACGYIKKPLCLFDRTGKFDPRSLTDFHDVIGRRMTLRIYSGQFLCLESEPALIEVKMFGVDGDSTRRHEKRIPIKSWNGFQATLTDSKEATINFDRVKQIEVFFLPIRSERIFDFCSTKRKKIICPDLALIRICVYDQTEKLLGQSTIPVQHIRSGFYHLVLKNAMNISTNVSTLFVHVRQSSLAKRNGPAFWIHHPKKSPKASTTATDSVLGDEQVLSSMPIRLHKSDSKSVVRAESKDEIETLFSVHLLASSEFVEIEKQLDVFSVQQIENEQWFREQRKAMHNEIRLLSDETNKVRSTERFSRFVRAKLFVFLSFRKCAPRNVLSNRFR